MTFTDNRLGPSALHRIRNRKAVELLERAWIENYEKNKGLLKHPDRVPFDSLTDNRDTCVILGAGPSLEANLKTLSTLGKNYSAIACDKAYPRTLEELDVHRRIRIVTALNSQSPKDVEGVSEVERFWRNVPNKGSIVLIAPITSDPLTFSTWNGRICPIVSSLASDLTERIHKETGMKPMNCGSNVGVFSYLMASRMGYKNIVLCGFDYSWKSKRQAMQLIPPGEPYALFEMMDVKGEIRWATWDWFDSAMMFFEYARFLWRNMGIKTYNCSNGGILYDNEFIIDKPLEEVLQ